MPDEIKGALFPVEDKKSEKAPDFTGVLNLDEEKIQIVAWKATSKKGDAYLSFRKEREMKEQNSYGESI